MFLSVALEVSVKNDAVIVSEEAIVGEGLRHLIFVVKDNMVERRVVRIGQRQQGRVEIVDGLKPGEIVIVRGVQRVRPGQTVDPKPVSAEAPAAEAAPTMPKRTSAPTVGEAPAGARHRRRRTPRRSPVERSLTRPCRFPTSSSAGRSSRSS